MIRAVVSAAAWAVFFSVAIVPASAQNLSSAYTRFNTDKCRHVKGGAPEDDGSWRCTGYRTIPIVLSADDQRMYVSFGSGKDDLAATQTFPAFNDVYFGTVEWRLEKSPQGRVRAFATILRWNVMLPSDQEKATGPVSPSGHVLVVTRLGPGGTCHVGYVDTGANRNANDLARKLADAHARSFRCGKDKRIVVGEVSPGLAMPIDRP